MLSLKDTGRRSEVNSFIVVEWVMQCGILETTQLLTDGVLFLALGI